MTLTSWGNYPQIKNKKYSFSTSDELKEILEKPKEYIPFGNGRSYGDSALNENIIHTKNYNCFLDFDEKNGILEVQSGVLLSEILEVIVPKGWFLKVTPGTKLITVGGAIASDVHGKNHHIDGCFSECVEEFTLMIPNGEIKRVKKEDELFFATCGGMGLTGVILSAKLTLKRIKSKNILQTTIKTKNLKETFDAFEKYNSSTYSVAWIDCLASKENLGRSLLMVGDFCDDGDLKLESKKKLKIPFFFPSWVLNKFTIKAFNYLYYNKVKEKISTKKVDFDTFFYPLDAILDWNKIYGKNGFTQYQFIIPKENSFDALQKILTRISKSNKGSFLAVLKLYGKENQNYLSFPLKGYSLALDFKIEDGVFELLDELDKIVLEYGGRIYLTKDARVKKENFKAGYPKLDNFLQIRQKYNLFKKFNSLQSKRIEI